MYYMTLYTVIQQNSTLFLIVIILIILFVGYREENFQHGMYYVNIVDNEFIPSVLEINKGDSVVWTNNDQNTHTVTDINRMFSKELYEHDIFSHKFTTPDIHEYYCMHHPSMIGSIIVNE